MPPVSGEPSTEALAPEHVIDRHGFVWRVVRDGGMATRADYTGQTSIGIEELRATRGPLIDFEARTTPPALDVKLLARAIEAAHADPEAPFTESYPEYATRILARLSASKEQTHD
jgi:hypothetical protein